MSWSDFFGRNFFYPESLPDIVCASNCFGDGAFSRASLILCLLAGMLVARRWWAIPIATTLALFARSILHSAFNVSTSSFDCLDYNTECLKQPVPGFFERLSGDLFFEFRHFSPGADEIAIGLVVTTLGYAIVKGPSVINAGAMSPLVRGATVGGLVLIALMGSAYLVFRSSPELLPRIVLEPASRLTGRGQPFCSADPKAIIKDLYAEADDQQRIKISSTGKRGDASTSPMPEIHSTWLTFEHRISRHIPIRVSNPKKYEPHRAIALEITIDESGRVIDAIPKSGPIDLYPQAIKLARGWKFVPFTANGEAVAVKYVRAKIGIDGPARTTPRREVPILHDRNGFIVRYQSLQRDAAFDLWMRGDGSVVFVGKEGSALQGKHCATLSDTAIDEVIGAVRTSGAFAMFDSYSTRNAGFQLDIAFGDNTKSVVVLESEDGDDTPPEMWGLVDSIMRAASVKRWLLGDRFTAQSLIAENWDFAEKSDSNTWLASRVVRFGEDQALHDLISLGAPLPDAPERVLGDGPLAEIYASSRETGIEEAASAASPSKLRMLLATRTKWSPEAVENAYVNALATDSDDLIRMLEQMRMANARTSTSDKSALMAAAESGYPDRVATQLERGGNPKEMGINRLASLHWAAGFEYPWFVPRTRADRGVVIKMLVQAGADLEARDSDGNTPLNVNWMGLPDVAAALIAAGADVDSQNDEMETPLMTNKSLKAVQLLLKAGANPRIPNRRGLNALDVARSDIFAHDIATEIERWMLTHPAKK